MFLVILQFVKVKEKDLPQHKSYLSRFSKEVCYVKDSNSKYKQSLSIGWDVKTDALDITWIEIDYQIKAAKIAVINNHKSPIYFFFIKNLMDFSVLKGYTGYSRWRSKFHMTPFGFSLLSEMQLLNYAEAFNIQVYDLINFKCE